MEGGALFHFSSLQAKRVSAHTGETLLPFSGFPRHIGTLRSIASYRVGRFLPGFYYLVITAREHLFAVQIHKAVYECT